jgi:GT2 family glycosyltransferase/glycosyltransferase involved in cell wall biosynthesis
VDQGPLISVIVAAFNHERFVEEALRSLAAQTYQPLELIVVDDGSTDGTFAEIQRLLPLLQERFQRVDIASKPHEGIARTLAACLRRAASDIVYMLDSDDIAVPQAVERLMQHLRAPEIALAVGDNEYIDADSRPITVEKLGAVCSTLLEFHTKGRVDFRADRDFGSYASLIGGNYVPNGWLFRRSAIIEVGGYHESFMLDDWSLLVRLAKKHRIVFAGEVLARYRLHAGNTNRLHGEALFLDAARVLVAERDYCRSHGLEREWIEHAARLLGALTPEQIDRTNFIPALFPELKQASVERLRTFAAAFAAATADRPRADSAPRIAPIAAPIPPAGSHGLRIHLYALCWNEARMLPFFFRHYDPFVERYVIFDDGSTDGSLELLQKHPRVEVRRFTRAHPDSFVLSELALYDTSWKESRGSADWVIVTDIDEHIWHPDFAGYLKRCRQQGVTVVPALGYEMISDSFPDPDEELCQTRTFGAPAADMCKLAIFDPDAIEELRRTPGGHEAHPIGRIVAPPRDELLLLHYKLLGKAYATARFSLLRTGLCDGDRRREWGHHWQLAPDELLESMDGYRARAVDVSAGADACETYPEARWWAGSFARLEDRARLDRLNQDRDRLAIALALSTECSEARARYLLEAEAQLLAARAAIETHEQRVRALEQSRTWRWTARIRLAAALARQLADALVRFLGRTGVRRWELWLESPAEHEAIDRAVHVSGWVFHRGSPVTHVEVALGSGTPVTAEFPLVRSDVALAYPADRVGEPGFRVTLEPSGEGPTTVHVVFRCADGTRRHVERSVRKVQGHEVRSVAAAAAPAPTLFPAQVPLAAPDRLADAVHRCLLEWTCGVATPIAVLDWTRSGRLTGRFEHTFIFTSPERSNPVLPYLDRSIDVVAIDVDDPMRAAEAERVAIRCVLRCSDNTASADAIQPRRAHARSVSIVIPVHGQWPLTRQCLEQLWQTTPSRFSLEVIVVDDGSPDETARGLEQLAAGEPRLRIVRHAINQGFGAACNSGAAAATGDVLVFLNNDTLPQPCWLEPLVDSLDQLPNAGAVGARLVGADGILQEAGGAVFRDGSAWNLGRGFSPDDPLLARVRAVDYCSAAALATRKSLFEALGGFDQAYAPAYYEDTDYCFRLRERGYETYVQPASTVVHLEGGTAGTDLARGSKQFQAVHRVRFRETHEAALDRQFDPPLQPSRFELRRVTARRRADARDVLVIAPTPAEFDRESGSRRVFQLIELFRQLDWQVTFIAQHETSGLNYVHALQQLGVEVWAGPDTPAASPRKLTDPGTLLREARFDLAVLHFWHLAERYLPTIREFSPNTSIWVDSVDLHLLRRSRERQSARQPLSDADGIDAARELNVYAASDRVLAVSRKEAALIDDLLGRPGYTSVLPDFERYSFESRAADEANGLLFLGNFRHAPNIAALEWLCRDILPRLDPGLLSRHPLTVVGNDLTEGLISRCGGPQSAIRWVGWVPAIEPYVRKARVMVVPLLSGAGTKRKLVQALMLGTPAVTTRVGAEGLDLVDGVHALIADSPQEFSTAIARLLTDERLWSRLANAGASHARESHGIDVAARALSDLVAAEFT